MRIRKPTHAPRALPAENKGGATFRAFRVTPVSASRTGRRLPPTQTLPLLRKIAAGSRFRMNDFRNSPFDPLPRNAGALAGLRPFLILRLWRSRDEPFTKNS